jgi:phosphoribosylformylglycinamidine synthase
MCYVDETGNVTEQYPANPNGSSGGATSFTTSDGRFTIMMPHPERLIRSLNYSWHPDDWGTAGPWFNLFINARKYVN